MSTFLAVFGNITQMALKVTLLHTIFMKNLAAMSAELFRCGNCESARGDLSFHTSRFWREKWFESRSGVLKLVVFSGFAKCLFH